MDEEWQTATAGKKKKGKRSSAAPAPVTQTRKHKAKIKGPILLDSDDDGLTVSECLASVASSQAMLVDSHYYKLLRDRLASQTVAALLRRVGVIYALGIGSAAKSVNAMTQLALLMLLKDHLRESDGREVQVFIFDPVMSDVDRAVCAALSITALTENAKGKYLPATQKVQGLEEGEGPRERTEGEQGCVDQVSLFFMPHCPYRLYCNVLWDHWLCLDRLLIIGNSFQSYQDRRLSLRVRGDRTDSVALLTEHAVELALWPLASKSQLASDLGRGVKAEAAFCDTSLMYFTNHKVRSLHEASFLKIHKPSDEEIEEANALDEELW